MSGKFQVYYDLLSDGQDPPKNVWEAAERGDVFYLNSVLERTVEVDVDMRDALMRTPLHWAAELGHVEAAKLLLSFGADVEAKECNGRTPVHLAARSADAGMLVLLLEAPETQAKERMVNQTDVFGITPVFLALQKGNEGHKALEVMVGCGARFSDPDAAKVHTISAS